MKIAKLDYILKKKLQHKSTIQTKHHLKFLDCDCKMENPMSPMLKTS